MLVLLSGGCISEAFECSLKCKSNFAFCHYDFLRDLLCFCFGLGN